jgi:polar amino acid transport system substrate-binding protein
VDSDQWDIGNIADEPARAAVMDFTNPYALIDAHFLVREDSKLGQYRDVDKNETTIAVLERSAYDLWLTENLRYATIMRASSMVEARELFSKGVVTVLAGLKPALMEEVANNPLYRVLEPRFTAIRQAVGIKRGGPETLEFLNNIIIEMISTGFIEDSLERHGVLDKLSVPVL